MVSFGTIKSRLRRDFFCPNFAPRYDQEHRISHIDDGCFIVL